MSEKIYALSLRLYPRNFREQYTDETLQLFRHQWRYEAGLLLRLRLWIDLLNDLFRFRLAHPPSDSYGPGRNDLTARANSQP
jgi:hypothetical protein